jgi:hypothetical protein
MTLIIFMISLKKYVQEEPLALSLMDCLKESKDLSKTLIRSFSNVAPLKLKTIPATFRQC